MNAIGAIIPRPNKGKTMLKKRLRNMIKESGRSATKKMILKEISDLQRKMLKASNIYLAIDIEHDILDRQSMLKWLNKKDV